MWEKTALIFWKNIVISDQFFFSKTGVVSAIFIQERNLNNYFIYSVERILEKYQRLSQLSFSEYHQIVETSFFHSSIKFHLQFKLWKYFLNRRYFQTTHLELLKYWDDFCDFPIVDNRDLQYYQNLPMGFRIEEYWG